MWHKPGPGLTDTILDWGGEGREKCVSVWGLEERQPRSEPKLTILFQKFLYKYYANKPRNIFYHHSWWEKLQPRHLHLNDGSKFETRTLAAAQLTFSRNNPGSHVFTKIMPRVFQGRISYYGTVFGDAVFLGVYRKMCHFLVMWPTFEHFTWTKWERTQTWEKMFSDLLVHATKNVVLVLL